MRIQSTVYGAALVLIALPLVTTISAAPDTPPAVLNDVPTFSKDVAPILYKNCTHCHRDGEIAPMSLLTYEDARPHAQAIIEELEGGTMPPWHADPKVGHFRNDRRLSDADKATLLNWAKNGAPKGNPADLPPAPKYVEGWSIGQPDLVLQMPVEYKLPAKGQIDYEYFEIPTNLTEDKWLQAIEVRAGNRAVVHHVIAYMRPAQAERRPTGIPFRRRHEHPRRTRDATAERCQPVPAAAAHRRDDRWLRARHECDACTTRAPRCSSAPGRRSCCRCTTRRTARSATDRTQARTDLREGRRRRRELRYGTLVNGAFKIPPGAESHEVVAEMTTTADVTMRQMLPHTHLRGKDWEYTAFYPDGRRRRSCRCRGTTSTGRPTTSSKSR